METTEKYIHAHKLGTHTYTSKPPLSTREIIGEMFCIIWDYAQLEVTEN